MDRKIMPLGAIGANCVILWEDPAAAWVVDPGAESESINAFLEKKGLTPALVLLTHGHFDHIGALDGLLARHPGLPVHIGPGDVPMIGHPQNAWPLHVIATPGHTPGGACFLFAEQKLLLTGDTLFEGSCGRTDFPGGNPRQLNESLRRLAGLDPELTVVPGHGSITTIAREVATNPFLQ